MIRDDLWTSRDEERNREVEVEDRFIRERMNEMILKKGIQLISPLNK